MASLAKATHRLFVYNLPWTVNAQKLKVYFSKFGEINSAHVVFDKNTGLSRGYGFIVFKTQIAYDAATNAPKHFVEEMAEESLRLKFNSAADHLPSLVPSLKPDKLLQFYALYKQATVGRCNTPRPNWYAIEAKQKWDAWNSLGNMSSEEAMTKYIALLSELATDWDTLDRPTSNGWVSVSTMRDSDSDLEESEKDIFDRVKEGDIDKVKSSADIENINILDDEGLGLLHWAADRGNKDMVKCLLELGADKNLRDNTGQTALHYACACGHKEVVELLLQFSADVNITCNDGYLPFDIAVDDEIRNIIKN